MNHDDSLLQFKRMVADYYCQHGRHDLSWRIDTRPYAIFISELMLQQTQVSRVIPKFNDWIVEFPDFGSLAQANQADVLRTWQGLGYNRRGRYAQRSAQMVVDEFGGELPQSQTELEQLPGIGPHTAGAIRAYAFNQPAVYIETNIRTVFIHHFFPEQTGVSDAQLLPVVEAALDTENPRQWYWAVMDYGAHLKQTIGNQNQRSKHYSKQSKFEGSFRQLRAAVLKTILASGSQSFEQIQNRHPDTRLDSALDSLVKDGLLQLSAGEYRA